MVKKRLLASIMLIALFVMILLTSTACSFGDLLNRFTPLSVTLNDKVYTSDAKGIVLDKQTTVSVDCDGVFEVQILPNPAVTDYSFQIGEENYPWQDIGEYNLADGFNLKQSNDSFELSYENLATIIYYSIGVIDYDISTPELPSNVDMFKLVISSGSNGITLGFNICDTDAHTFDGGFTIELDPDRIIF